MSAQVQLSHFKRAFSEMSDSTPDSSFNTSCSVEASSQSLTFTSDESLSYAKHLTESKQLRDEMKAKTAQNVYYENEPTQALSCLTTPVFQSTKKTKERKYTASEVQKLIDEAVQLHDIKIREEFAITLNRVIKEHIENLSRFHHQQLLDSHNDSSYIS